MRPDSQRVLRAIAFGLVAVGLAYLCGFVLSSLQNPLALMAIFVAGVAAATFGPSRIAQAIRTHPRVMAPAALVLFLVAVLYLISPTYIGPGFQR